MNAERLLRLFDRVADAPEAIPRTRRLILDLAVRGKLVPQNLNDDSATVPADCRALHTGKQGDSAVRLPPPPSGWVFASLSEVCESITDGDHLPPPRAQTGVPFLVIGNVRTGTVEFSGERFVTKDYFDRLDSVRRPRRGDLLYTLVGSFGIPVVVRDDREFCVQRHIGILRPSGRVNVEYLALAMAATASLKQASAVATGIAQKTVPLGGLRRIRVPLPPLAEQQRIVAKVDELMALCDRLEDAQKRRDSARDRVVTNAVVRLGTVARDNRPKERRFVDAGLSVPTNSRQIDQLKNRFLSLAVTGHLTGTAVESGDNAEALRAPAGWAEKVLSEVCEIRSGVAKGKQYGRAVLSAIPYLRVANVQRGFLDLDVVKTIEVTSDEANKYRLRTGDVLMTEGGDWDKLGRAAVWRDELPGCIHQNHVFCIRPRSLDEVLPEWIELVANSPEGRRYFEGASKQTTNLASINKSQLSRFPVPLPPIGQQRRILAVLKDLMLHCKALESKLASGDRLRSRLLDSLVAEALASSEPVPA